MSDKKRLTCLNCDKYFVTTAEHRVCSDCKEEGSSWQNSYSAADYGTEIIEDRDDVTYKRYK